MKYYTNKPLVYKRLYSALPEQEARVEIPARTEVVKEKEKYWISPRAEFFKDKPIERHDAIYYGFLVDKADAEEKGKEKEPAGAAR